MKLIRNSCSKQQCNTYINYQLPIYMCVPISLNLMVNTEEHYGQVKSTEGCCFSHKPIFKRYTHFLCNASIKTWWYSVPYILKSFHRPPPNYTKKIPVHFHSHDHIIQRYCGQIWVFSYFTILNRKWCNLLN